jgi:hypothetical protein
VCPISHPDIASSFFFNVCSQQSCINTTICFSICLPIHLLHVTTKESLNKLSLHLTLQSFTKIYFDYCPQTTLTSLLSFIKIKGHIITGQTASHNYYRQTIELQIENLKTIMKHTQVRIVIPNMFCPEKFHQSNVSLQNGEFRLSKLYHKICTNQY